MGNPNNTQKSEETSFTSGLNKLLEMAESDKFSSESIEALSSLAPSHPELGELASCIQGMQKDKSEVCELILFSPDNFVTALNNIRTESGAPEIPSSNDPEVQVSLMNEFRAKLGPDWSKFVNDLLINFASDDRVWDSIWEGKIDALETIISSKYLKEACDIGESRAVVER